MHTTLSLGHYDAAFRTALERLDRDHSVARLWKKDPTLWKPEPDQQAVIANSLGWLNVAETMQSHLADLEAFAQDVKNAGFEFCVVLGMGGASLCPEALARAFNPREGFPQLYVLDSTVPTAIRHLEQKINLANTLFIVASKSSLTTEPQLFHRYFRDRVKRIKGDTCGENFVAITDPGSQLAREAAHGHFRRMFLETPDIGAPLLRAIVFRIGAACPDRRRRQDAGRSRRKCRSKLPRFCAAQRE